MTQPHKSASRYARLIEEIFNRHYAEGLEEFVFDREEIVEVAKSLKMRLPKNLGDVLYSFRFRQALPAGIAATATVGAEWIIELAGTGRYRFRLCQASRIVPRDDLRRIKIPDNTPEIISRYALSDEQALLAKVRYNRLIDVFLGITAYSLQNHLRTTVPDMGQIEIDEVYVGVDRHGVQFVVPVQAKGGSDRLGAVQAGQDLAWCRERLPLLACRPVAVQFMKEDVIAMFELVDEEGDIRVAEERHYRLVPADEISEQDLSSYGTR